MSIVFAARADNANFLARYGNGGLIGRTFASSGSFSYNADATSLTGNVWTFPTSGTKALIYPAKKNTPNGRQISMLIRKVAGYSGAPSASNGIVSISSAVGRISIEINHLSGSGNISVLAKNEQFTTVLNSSIGVHSPVSGTRYDYFFSWDGTTTANSFKFYVNASLLGQLTPAAAFDVNWSEEWFREIIFGISDTFSGPNANIGALEEAVIWDSVIDPTSVGLVSGTGSLNGASRTSLVDVGSLDGSDWSTLSADKIKTGETQQQAGVTVNGTYDGSDRYTEVSESNVLTRQGDYKFNSLTNNKTPNVTLPSTSDVVSGVQYGASGTEFTGVNTGQIVYGEGDFRQTIAHEDDTILNGIIIEDTSVEGSDGVVIEDTDSDKTTVVIITGGEDD